MHSVTSARVPRGHATIPSRYKRPMNTGRGLCIALQYYFILLNVCQQAVQNPMYLYYMMVRMQPCLTSFDRMCNRAKKCFCNMLCGHVRSGSELSQFLRIFLPTCVCDCGLMCALQNTCICLSLYKIHPSLGYY